MINEDQLRELWEDIRLTHPDKIMDSFLEAVMKYHTMGLKMSIEEPGIDIKMRRWGSKETMSS